jgi:hypothetical protein
MATHLLLQLGQPLGQIQDERFELGNSSPLLSNNLVSLGDLPLEFGDALKRVHPSGRSCRRSRRQQFF